MRQTLTVIYTARLEECTLFYRGLGLEFVRERHGSGPEHHAAVLPDGTVFELYPAADGRSTGALRLGFSLDAPPDGSALEPGRQVLRDPDGRAVEIHIT
ncbi:glyoxalase/bleomycin resistance/dioxygenase family protein [Rhizohabitans arisaemae]|uniref:glyoxalase/bleomycin resistance/dioxygenase family protein n=1 Tax=Rhizohabitans arisaemae TaxID=2720610 RepID=UPI0024B06D25|nr:glyoxalase/bleomycin resistance/dioxygenase family protein [Rhizohabitans arisaemae]